MKVNFNLLPFKSKLMIDNRQNSSQLEAIAPFLKESFESATSEHDDTLIINTVKFANNDEFKLFDESGNLIVSYKAPLSKYIGKADDEAIASRLKNVYSLMKIKESFSLAIRTLKQYMQTKQMDIKEIQSNPNMSKEEKSNEIKRLNNVISFIKKDITYQSRACTVECDSFEALHGMRSELD